jgi:polar amino acid transport system substrate-binding protein
MRNAFVTVWLVIVLTVSLFSTAIAGPVMDRILKQGELKVGITGSQPPLNATTKNGDIIGMDADLANLIASGLGVKLKFATMPFDQLLPSLEKGQIDLVVSSMSMNLERNRTVAFVGPYYASGKGILTKTKNIPKLQGKESLNATDFTVAVLKDSTSQAFVEQTAPKAKTVQSKSYDEALELLIKDQVDAIVADLPYCVFTAIRYRDQGLEAGESPLSFEPLGFAVKEDALLINWLENFLEIIKQTGMLKKVHARWFQDGSWIKDLK